MEMRTTIVHKSGTRSETRQELAGKTIYRIGRHPDNDCVFESASDAGVSAFHAEIRVANNRVTIVDMGSTNGVMVEGKRVKEVALEPGQEVKLGMFGPAFVVDFQPAKMDPRDATIPIEMVQIQKERKYGQRTVGMMIRQALAQAGLLKRTGTSKSTDYLEALVDKKVRRTSSRFKKILIVSIAAVVVVAALALGWMYRNRSYQVVNNYGDTVGGSIAANNRYAVFMVAGRPAEKGRPVGDVQGFCTAFAVEPDILATNAHCVVSARELFTDVKVLMNGTSNGAYQVLAMVPHPGYEKGVISPDVALMRINSHLQHVVRMATAQELATVAPGVPVFLYGFPGRLNKEDAPEATFTKGDVGRITAFSQRLGDFGQNTLLQHSAFSAAGTSGSPIFNSAGSVIGINAGGYLEDGQKLAGYNFGMRIDLLNTLFPLLGAK